MAVDSIASKCCTKCSETKPLVDFNRHAASKDGRRPDCRECQKKRLAKYHTNNKAKNNKRAMKWYYENKELANMKQREWYRNNRETRLNSIHKYQADNKEKRRETVRRWVERNPDAVSTAWRNYRARKYNAPGTHTKKDIDDLFAKQKGRCWWCTKRIKSSPEADHRIPLARGGSNGIENIVISCGPCNRRKWMKMPSEFAGRLL